jgi:signal transduction histidine kinase
MTGGGVVRIWVTDSGEGIPADVRKRLFEPFFTTKARGVGLGLAVCSRVVEAHHGEITVDSTVGEGSTFRVTLPIVVTPRQPADDEVWTEVTT